MAKKIYSSIGIMNGTSLDGIDISLIQSDGVQYIKFQSNETYNYPIALRKKLTTLTNKINNKNFSEILNTNFFKQVESEFSQFCLNKVKIFFDTFYLKNEDIDIIGFHGPTLFHNANLKISIQLGDVHFLSKQLKTKIVFDFRNADLLNGGQGAPLVPIFHKVIFSSKKNVAIINIGGISNITLLKGKTNIYSTDIGPGNVLIDEFCRINFKKNFDKNGEIASLGSVNTQYINKWLNLKIFKKKIPRSYNKNDFKLTDFSTSKINSNYDKLNTLVSLTSELIICSKNFFVKPDYWIICGGGAKNNCIIEKLKKDIREKVFISSELGFSPDFIESQAFAYLAIRKLIKLASTFPSTTGVKKPTVCGKITD